MDNMGIFHPFTSYNGMIAVSFQACSEMMPDPQFDEECLLESFSAGDRQQKSKAQGQITDYP